jgi:hypothetical protein
MTSRFDIFLVKVIDHFVSLKTLAGTHIMCEAQEICQTCKNSTKEGSWKEILILPHTIRQTFYLGLGHMQKFIILRNQ